jgi:uncharacterized protein (DUF4415 family)
MKNRGEVSDPRPGAAVGEIPEAFWEEARPFIPPEKTSIHLRLDADVLEWFKAQGPGHLTRMNAVLRSYFEAHQKRKKSARSSRG